MKKRENCFQYFSFYQIGFFIAIYLKQKRAAGVNLHRLQKEQSKRVIDFLSGVIFAIEGDIQQIGPKIFLCTPKNIGVSGNITMDSNESEE